MKFYYLVFTLIMVYAAFCVGRATAPPKIETRIQTEVQTQTVNVPVPAEIPAGYWALNAEEIKGVEEASANFAMIADGILYTSTDHNSVYCQSGKRMLKLLPDLQTFHFQMDDQIRFAIQRIKETCIASSPSNTHISSN